MIHDIILKHFKIRATMKFSVKQIVGFLVVSLAVASAFNMRPTRMTNRKTAAFMANEKAPVELVPVDKTNVENAAAVTGGILGLVLLGPVGALILSAITNYVVKKDNESGEALRGLGKTVVESYNFLTKLNSKYDITGATVNSLGNVVSSIESENDTVQTVKSTVSTTVQKVDELNKEYDFVAKTKQVASAASVLSDTAIDKVVELNAKVKILNFIDTRSSPFAYVMLTLHLFHSTILLRLSKIRLVNLLTKLKNFRAKEFIYHYMPTIHTPCESSR